MVFCPLEPLHGPRNLSGPKREGLDWGDVRCKAHLSWCCTLPLMSGRCAFPGNLLSPGHGDNVMLVGISIMSQRKERQRGHMHSPGFFVSTLEKNKKQNLFNSCSSFLQGHFALISLTISWVSFGNDTGFRVCMLLY